jgi:hypothetical protein
MQKMLGLISRIRTIGAVWMLLFFSAMAIILAFPATRGMLTSSWTNGIMLCTMIILGELVLDALLRKRWISALIHLGATLIIIGGGITASKAKDGQIVFTDADYAPPEYRQCIVGGDRVALHSFEMPTYPDGMPKQYITHLIFPEGTKTVSVNAPLRRKGYTYYQMSYQQVEGYYGEPVYNTILTVRKDPGAKVTFWGYGCVIVAAFALALRESRSQNKTRKLEVAA